MTDLSKILENGESEIIEFKRSLSLYNKILTAISSFSNKRGGSIFVGIEDDGTVVGVDIGGNTIENLANDIRRETDPSIFPFIDVVKKEGKDIIIIKVEENEEKPVFFRDKAFTRVGKTNQQLSSAQIRNMVLNENSIISWDGKICEEAKIDDIDEKKLRWVLEKGNNERNMDLDLYIPVEEALTKLKLLRGDKLTNAAVLLFGLDPQKFFRQAEIKCAKFKGVKPINFSDRKIFRGNIIDQRDKAIEFIKEHTYLRTTVKGAERFDKSEYPIEAIREAITNAVCHRNYRLNSDIQVRIFNDRLEIWGCGPLPNNLTIDEIERPHNSHPRNPLIADCFFDIKFIEQWGTGIERMIQSCSDAGLPEPLFEIKSGDFVVTLKKYKISQSSLDELKDRQVKAINYLLENERITNKEYRSLNPDIARSTAVNDLKELINKRFIIRKGFGSNTYYVLAE